MPTIPPLGPNILKTPSGVVPSLMELPSSAMVPGIAKDTNGKRVGVYGSSESNVGVWGESKSGKAGYFDGDVDINKNMTVHGDVDVNKNMAVQGNAHVTGNISAGGDIVLSNADCAEDFDLAVNVDPGTVMVLNDEGSLEPSRHPV